MSTPVPITTELRERTTACIRASYEAARLDDGTPITADTLVDDVRAHMRAHPEQRYSPPLWFYDWAVRHAAEVLGDPDKGRATPTTDSRNLERWIAEGGSTE